MILELTEREKNILVPAIHLYIMDINKDASMRASEKTMCIIEAGNLQQKVQNLD